MGWDVLSQLRSRKVSHDTHSVTDLGTDGKDTTFTKSGESNDDLSLKEANEKEIETNPNTVSKKDPIGVQKAEAAALVWSKKAVYATYAWVWVCFFMLALQSSIMTYATVAAYSTFSATPAYTTASILGNIVGGVLKLPIAKLLNLWGRAEGFVFGFTIYLVGLIILAAGSGSTSYAAGYTLYWIGYDALYLIMDVFVADTSGLRNRAWAFAFVSTPFICTAFTGPLAANSFLAHTTWRWAIAAFCIIQPVVFLPLAVVFKFYQKKAQKMGLYRREPSGRTTLQSIVHYFHEFDVIGALLLMAAFVILLLPFSLITYARITFDSPTFVAMVIVGVLLFPVFAIWEKYFARTHFVRWELFRQRTLLGACLLAGVLFFSFYCWNLNFYNFCKVVYALKVADAGYMTQIYNVGSTFWGVVFGVWVRKTKHFKYACLCFGLPVLFLGAGLLIHFRGEDHGIGYVIMCQIFIAIGGGMLVIGEDMAAMAACDREGVAMALALIYLSSAIGGAIGDAVAGSIYGATWRKAAISKGLSPSFAEEMYLGGYMKQEMFIPGTMEREAFNYAWSQTLRWGGVASTCILILAIPAIAMWKNYRVDKKQNKGTVI